MARPHALIALLLAGCGGEPPPPAPVAPEAPEAPAPVGSSGCAACHASEHEAWKGSHHALAEREAGPGDGWARELGGVRVIGVEPVVQALIPAADGRLQAHEEAFDPRDGTRFDIFTDGRQAGEWGHWTGGGNTWNGRCAACHDTQVAKGWDGKAYATEYAELGVGCEACHGDGDAHAAGGPAPANARMEDTCAACHARRAELTGEFQPGDAFLDHFVPVLLDDAAVFAADGRALDEAFEWNQIVASPMHTGGARCGDCHDPHSGALLHAGDTLCTRCHDDLGTKPHGDGACVDCHMPFNRLMARHDRRDHGFTRPGDTRFEAFEKARTGGGWAGLDLKVPDRGRRAAHVAALARYPDDADAREALRTAMADADPLVRAAAVNALIPADRTDADALETAAQDPVRAVRVGAQRALVQAGAPLSRAPDYQRYLDHNADDPTALAERGTVRVRAGDPGGLEDLATAAKLDPSSPDLVVIRAVGLSSAGRQSAAVSVLREGLARFPDHVELKATLGLALAAIGETTEAIAMLEAAVAAEPQRTRAWRNLALLYAGELRNDDARTAAEHAVALDPSDTELAEWIKTL